MLQYCVNIDSLGALCFVLVLFAYINVEVAEELSAKTVLGKHTLHDTTEEFVCTVGLSEDRSGRVLALTAGVAGVGVVSAIRHLLTGQDELVGVDDDDVVTAVNVGSKVGLVLTTEQFGDLRSKATEHLVGGVNDDPLFLCGFLVGRNGLVA